MHCASLQHNLSSLLRHGKQQKAPAASPAKGLGGNGEIQLPSSWKNSACKDLTAFPVCLTPWSRAKGTQTQRSSGLTHLVVFLPKYSHPSLLSRTPSLPKCTSRDGVTEPQGCCQETLIQLRKGLFFAPSTTHSTTFHSPEIPPHTHTQQVSSSLPVWEGLFPHQNPTPRWSHHCWPYAELGLGLVWVPVLSLHLLAGA